MEAVQAEAERATKILLIEDNAADARFVSELLSESGRDSYELSLSPDLESGLDRLSKEAVDVVLLDLGLPGSTGVETFKRAHAEAPEIPIVLLTGLKDEELALQAVQEGAQNYLVKGEVTPDLLARELRYARERGELLRAMQQEREDELRIRDEFVSHVSHELRTPLAAAHEFLSILLDGVAGELLPRQREYLEIVVRNANHLNAMIGDLLELTRIQVGRLTVDQRPIRLEPIVDEVAAVVQAKAEARSLSVAIDIPAPLPQILADGSRVTQVLLNLIDNAVKFSEAGQGIEVACSVPPQQGELVQVSVRDSGRGMSPQETQRVFDRLYQAKKNADGSRRGLGLGLYICREIVRRHGGRIWVESEEGVGSVFHFTLPIYSVRRLIEPIFAASDEPEVYSLVSVEVQRRDGRPFEDADRRDLTELGGIVRGCILPGLDVMLPSAQTGAGKETHHVVARAGPAGSGVLAERLRSQLAGAAGKTLLSWTVTNRTLDVVRRAQHSDDQWRDLVAGEVTARTRTDDQGG